jgi:hypothetical protein
MNSLLEAHAYLAAMDLRMDMQNVDGEQGFGLGVFYVSPPHVMPNQGPGTETYRQRDGVRALRIPILVNEYKLCPFDIVIDERGKVYPLNEERVRRLLYRPQLFDATTQKNERSAIDRVFMPLLRQGNLSGVSDFAADYMKYGSALVSMLPGADHRQIEATVRELQDDSTLLKAASHDPVISRLLAVVGAAGVITPSEKTKLASEMLRPNVVQYRRVGDFYKVKMANTTSFAPAEATLDYPTLVEDIGRENAHEVNSKGTLTLTADPVVDEVLEEAAGSLVTQFGEWRVKGRNGVERVGWVFPEVRSFTGVRLPVKIFNNGDSCAIQEEIAGSFVGAGVNLVRGAVKGRGLFYRITNSGTVVAFEPCEIQNGYTQNNQLVYELTTVTDPLVVITVRQVPELKLITKLRDREYGIPVDVRWMPLGASLVELVSTPEAFAKLSSARTEVRCRGGRWSFQGAAVEKIAGVMATRDLDGPDAMFVSACLGLSPSASIKALEKAATGRSVRIFGCRSCVLPAERVKTASAVARPVAQHYVNVMPSSRSLIKEALHLSKFALDELGIDTLDQVLSLGYLSPSNAASAVEHLPSFEDSVNRLAALLLDVRLGAKIGTDDGEIAVKTAMDSFEKVIAGLRKLVRTRN